MKNIAVFLHEVKIEMGKVVWPKFDDFIGSTIVVLILIGAFSIYLGIIDLSFSKFAKYLFKVWAELS